MTDVQSQLWKAPCPCHLIIELWVIVKNNSQNLLSANTWPTVGRQTANCGPTDSQLSVDRWQTVRQQSLLCLRPKCWPTVGQQMADSR